MTWRGTPGPWEICPRDGETVEVSGTTYTVNRGRVVALCHGPDREANAHAIAAVPQMVEALLEVRKNLGDPVPIGRRHVARKVEEALRAAKVLP